MASVAVGISYMGALDVKQGHLAQSYRGPLNLHLLPLGHCGFLDFLLSFVKCL
jgi:hypothetical protein